MKLLITSKLISLNWPMRRYWQTLASGNSVYEAKDGIIYEVFPDGRRKEVKKIDPGLDIKEETKHL